MIKKEKRENKTFFKKAINYLKSTGYTNIKADLKGYQNPKSFVKKSNGSSVTADITANKNGRKYFFDISLKCEESKLLKSKWLLLDTVARLKSNRFKIITTRGHYKFTENLLKDVNLENKTPIKI